MCKETLDVCKSCLALDAMVLTHGGMGAGGLVRGSITVDGHPKVHETFRRIASYVEQFDIHSPGATVHEALLFSAQLRLIGVSKPDARKFVDEARSPL